MQRTHWRYPACCWIDSVTITHRTHTGCRQGLGRPSFSPGRLDARVHRVLRARRASLAVRLEDGAVGIENVGHVVAHQAEWVTTPDALRVASQCVARRRARAAAPRSPRCLLLLHVVVTRGGDRAGQLSPLSLTHPATTTSLRFTATSHRPAPSCAPSPGGAWRAARPAQRTRIRRRSTRSMVHRSHDTRARVRRMRDNQTGRSSCAVCGRPRVAPSWAGKGRSKSEQAISGRLLPSPPLSPPLAPSPLPPPPPPPPCTPPPTTPSPVTTHASPCMPAKTRHSIAFALHSIAFALPLLAE